MLNKCCLCIGLRPATLILAALGASSNLHNAWRLSGISSHEYGALYSSMATYYLTISIVCLLGFIGVLKNKLKYVKVFAYYYWFQLVLGFILSIVFSVLAFYFDKDICQSLVERTEVDMDLDQCMEWYVKTAAMMVVLLELTCLIELHFCLAVWAYYKKLRAEQSFESHIHNIYSPVPAYVVIPPPSYDTIAGEIPAAADTKISDKQ